MLELPTQPDILTAPSETADMLNEMRRRNKTQRKRTVYTACYIFRMI